ncbi:MAG TPA: PD-(D/E)XK nuclease family protein [Longimicrobiales bacterium]
MALDPRSHPRLLLELAAATREDPTGRKLLVCPRPAEGRELLHALALAGVPWAGWEVTSLRQLAHEVVAIDVARAGWRVADEFDRMALVDDAIDAVVRRGEAGPFGTEAGAGFRDALRRSIETLREAGLDAAAVRRAARPGDAKTAALAAVLEEVEAAFATRRLMDEPGVLHTAVDALAAGRVALPEASLFLLPGHRLGGVAGRLLRLLVERGRARLLPTDSVAGLDAPAGVLWSAPAEPTGPLSRLHAPVAGEHGAEVELFAAATPTDELREVLRRAVAGGIPWDRIEIVASDPHVYGAALDALARRLGIPVTYAAGLDVRRTRVGRAAESYLRWISEGFPADVLRRMLEAGDLAPPAEGERADGVGGASGGPDARPVSGMALARRLRRLHIGWGRTRYLPAVDRALAGLRDARAPDDDGDPDAARAWREREARELRALRALLARLLDAAPALPDRAGDDRVRTSPAAVAAGLLAFLSLVPAGDVVENTARKILSERLERARETLTRETGWRAAVGLLRARIATRVAPSAADGRVASWTSAGGHLHLSDLETGGLSGRPHVFVVGLAAESVSAGGVDPLLGDGDRARLNAETGVTPAPLPTAAERIAGARHRLAAVLARLRGRITLSYSAWDATEGRVIAPAPELLQALRLREGDPSLTYEDLRAAFGRLVSAVPRGDGRAEPADVWLGALALERGGLRSGVAVVRAAHDGLDRGLVAAAEREREEATAYHGRIEPRPGLDPRQGGAVFSASRLEALGACPRRYFLRYVLGVRAVRDPEWDPERWLDALDRGTLLHAVYERTLGAARDDGIDAEDEAFERLALRVLGEEIERTLAHRPAPNDAVLAAETTALEADVRAFVDMIRRTKPEWIARELAFGPGEREVAVPLPGGPVRLAGRVDRIDRTAEGRLRVIDYKTGSAGRYRASRPFEGGRRLQHILYALAVERLLGEPVEAMEYHFPTVDGRNERVVYPRAAIADGPAIVETLLAIAADGHFLPTNEAADCRFCDFQRVCRAETDEYGATRCPGAAWSNAAFAKESVPEPVRRLKMLREQHA